MPRGGARKGAGRPAKQLSADERFWIFHECNRLRSLLTAIKHRGQERQYWARFDRLKDGSRIRLEEAWKTMNSWSPATRRRALADEDEETSEGRTLRDAMAESKAIEAANGGHRFHRIPLTRLSDGQRSRIVERVALRASDRFGKPVSYRQVRSIWEDISAAVRRG